MRQGAGEWAPLAMCEAPLGPGLGFGSNQLANRASPRLQTTDEASWRHVGPSHSFCPLGADTWAGMRTQVWALQGLGLNPASH